MGAANAVLAGVCDCCEAGVCDDAADSDSNDH